MSVSNGHDEEWPRDYIRSDRGGSTSSASIRDGFGKASAAALWLGVIGCVLGSIGFTLGIVAMTRTSAIVSMAEQTGRAVAKAETATARANTAEIYAYQVYTELNRLGYPVRTPAEDHVPQPPTNPPEVP
jgi:hypothetical protein